MFRKSKAEAIAFVSTLLVYDPNIRPRPLAALLDPYFNELRDQNTKIPSGMALPELFNFTQGNYKFQGLPYEP